MVQIESATSVETVFQTLAVRDPEKLTVTAGSAAIAVHLAEAGAPVCNYKDVDVLCSGAFFEQACSQSAAWDDGSVLRVRRSGTTPRTRMVSPVLDIYPPDDDVSVVSFSASEAMGGTWYPTRYSDCTPETVMQYKGYQFLKMAQLLIWTAASGREKDMAKLEAVVPLARDYGLVTQEEYGAIMAERDLSARLRSAHPLRYYARVPGS